MSILTPAPAPPPGPSQGAPAFDRDQVLAFLGELACPRTGCVEMRVFRARYERGFVVPSPYQSTLAGWYDDFHKLAVDAGRLRGVSGYVTVNPITTDLLSRSDNQLVRVERASSAEDVLAIRWLYLDIDSRRRDGISATDAELAAAVALRDAILDDHPELAASGMWGKSGNGGWILARLGDLPNDEATHERVVRMTARLAAQYDDDAAFVDVKTTNAARVMVLPGLLKTKGSNRPERPWRMATIDGGLGR